MLDLAFALTDARERTFALVADLTDEQLMGPRLSIVNPLLWEIGHVAWFQEHWVLRHAYGRPPLRADADSLFDSTAIPHDVRWDLPLPSRAEVLDYLRAARDGVLERLAAGPSPREEYFFRLTLFHEDMHGEAFLMTRQTLAYPPPSFLPPPSVESASAHAAESRGHDVLVPGGTFRLGAERGGPFVFDNEKWAHAVEVAPFSIARDAVTQAEFARFVDDGGYAKDDLWSPDGLRWRKAANADAPVHWRRAGDGWERRRFNAWISLEPDLPMVHVNGHEADAYCRWARRRLPTEAEWEMAAACEAAASGRLAPQKRLFPWGDFAPMPDRANLDARAAGCVPAASLAAGDSAFGCRQMVGNVWEWTSSDFQPYPGFVADPYKEYSQPWFGDHRVLRGGCFATRGRMLRNTWRNFYTPDRRDVFAGFRTCAR